MILTNCAACAAPLPRPAKQCSRCKTLYCDPACQKQHWDGGHKDFCKKIKKAGGAEQYNANTKYTEAAAVAVEKCADDTKGQTCYICTQALHWKTKEGLVRMCACRGTAGFAHVSCLAEQAKILREEAEANNLGSKALRERWMRWYTCSLCEQKYHGVVSCALGWACWKTYVGRPETDIARGLAGLVPVLFWLRRSRRCRRAVLLDFTQCADAAPRPLRALEAVDRRAVLPRRVLDRGIASAPPAPAAQVQHKCIAHFLGAARTDLSALA